MKLRHGTIQRSSFLFCCFLPDEADKRRKCRACRGVKSWPHSVTPKRLMLKILATVNGIRNRGQFSVDGFKSLPKPVLRVDYSRRIVIIWVFGNIWRSLVS